MKKLIEIAVTSEKVIKRGFEIDLPETSKYYKKEDSGRFFPRGLMLFAIITRYPCSYILVYVERNKQDFNDFKPLDDCRSDYWLKDFGIRKTAFEIINSPISKDGWEEISIEQFNEERILLLNNYQSYEQPS